MPDDDHILSLHHRHPVRASNGGLFISRGDGQVHPSRVIDSWELILLRTGRLVLEEEGRPLTLAPEQTLLLRPGLRHRGVEPYSADTSFYWVHFHPPQRKKLPPSERFGVPQITSPRRPDRLAELMHRFLDDQKSGRLATASADLLVTLMLWEVADSTPADLGGEAAAALAGRAEAFIAAHAHEPISRSSVALALGCNADYLGRAFRTATGITLTDAIHRQRVADARRLLLDSSLNVEQIAERCGFSDAGYFRRIFRRHQGLSPGRYRRLHRRLHVNWR